MSSIRFGINGNLDEQTKYKYDKAGNITEVFESGILASRYAYDKLNRMVREDNKAFGKTTVFTYDVGGNILSKAEYAFTLGGVEDKTPVSVIPYSYRASGWRDQMTAFNGEKCEYDVMGRPTKYRNKQLVWSKYGTLVNNGGNTYSYDANGIRQSKTVDGDTTEFFTDGSKILRSVDNNHDIWYNYGVNGIQGITVNGIKYVFRKNVFGDVTHIYKLNEGALELAAEYKYDAWGKCIVTEADESGIGAINPIRYRGYYFDAESGLYYLNARYYDPETGRFISADETKFLDPNTVNGLNLYAYCVNNPVMNIDPSGRFFIAFFIGSLIAIAVSTLVGAAVGGISAAIHGESVLQGIGNGAALGAMVGFSAVLIAIGMTRLSGILETTAIGAGVGSLFGLGLTLYSHSESGGLGSLDLKQSFSSWWKGGVIGATAGAVGKIYEEIGKSFGQALGHTLSNSTFLGINISKVFSKELLMSVFALLGGGVGSFIGGNLVNYMATYSKMQEKNIPLWLITILKFFGVI